MPGISAVARCPTPRTSLPSSFLTTSPATRSAISPDMLDTAFPGLYGGQHLTSTGYPCNIDSCNKMHRVDAEARLGSNNTAIIGSDMRGGSSGGGWLMNW